MPKVSNDSAPIPSVLSFMEVLASLAVIIWSGEGSNWLNLCGGGWGGIMYVHLHHNFQVFFFMFL